MARSMLSAIRLTHILIKAAHDGMKKLTRNGKEEHIPLAWFRFAYELSLRYWIATVFLLIVVIDITLQVWDRRL